IELYELRILLECEAMQRIPLPVAYDELAALHQIQSQHDDAVLRDDQRSVFRSNQAFHERLYGLCGNAVLAQAIQDYARRTHGIRFSALSTPEQQQRSMREHHALLKALEEGRREDLVQLVRQHLLPSRDRYLALSRARRSTASRVNVGRLTRGRTACGRRPRWPGDVPEHEHLRRPEPREQRYRVQYCRPSNKDCFRNPPGHVRPDPRP